MSFYIFWNSLQQFCILFKCFRDLFEEIVFPRLVRWQGLSIPSCLCCSTVGLAPRNVEILSINNNWAELTETAGMGGRSHFLNQIQFDPKLIYYSLKEQSLNWVGFIKLYLHEFTLLIFTWFWWRAMLRLLILFFSSIFVIPFPDPNLTLLERKWPGILDLKHEQM